MISLPPRTTRTDPLLPYTTLIRSEVPTAPVTVAVSLANKLDTLIRFFSEGELPTGSKDPFALRRAVLAAIRLLVGRRQSGASLTTILLAATYFHYEQRSEEHTSELQSLMSISYAVFCLKKKNRQSIYYIRIKTSSTTTTIC